MWNIFNEIHLGFFKLLPQYKHALENKGWDLKEAENVGNGRQPEEYLNDGMFWKKEGILCLLLKSSNFVAREKVY